MTSVCHGYFQQHVIANRMFRFWIEKYNSLEGLHICMYIYIYI